MKVYLFTNTPDGNMIDCYAMCEDGEMLAYHTCSHAGYMKLDLYTSKIDRYKKKFPNGDYELVYLPLGKTPPKSVIEANQKIYGAKGDSNAMD